MANKKLVVFLGNPGNKYRKTRHNIAWRMADLPRWSDLSWKDKFHGLYAVQSSACLLKPQTMMNNSGRSVQAAQSFFQLEPRDILVVHDDLEMPYGQWSLKMGGGLAGHNGLKSIKAHLKNDGFYRLRLGIGRPIHGSVHSWVLGAFDPIEESRLEDFLEEAIGGLEEFLRS